MNFLILFIIYCFSFALSMVLGCSFSIINDKNNSKVLTEGQIGFMSIIPVVNTVSGIVFLLIFIVASIIKLKQRRKEKISRKTIS